MKLLFTLLFALLASIASAQPPASAGKQSTAVAPSPASTPSTSKPVAHTEMSEAEYYKKMYEMADTTAKQAQAAAEHAHSDTQWGYGINVTVIVALIAIILAVQLVNTNAELTRLRTQIQGDLATNAEQLRAEMTTVQQRVLTALSEGHERNLTAINARIDTTRTELRNEITSYLNQLNNAANQYPTGLKHIRGEAISNAEVAELDKAGQEIATQADAIINMLRRGEDVEQKVRELIDFMKNRDIVSSRARYMFGKLDELQHEIPADKPFREPLIAARESLNRLDIESTSLNGLSIKNYIHKGTPI